MKYFILLFLCFPFLGYCQIEETFEYDGLQREYIYYAPEDVPENAPLVFVMHGYTSSNQFISSYSGFNEIADVHKIAVCYPNGTPDNFGTNHWNANLTISERDDVGFLSALAVFLQQEKNLSADHTFACGMSNGGFMSYTLACQAPDVFKAIASITGTMSGADWNDCDSNNPIPIFQISGLEDNTVPVDGSMSTFGGWGGAPDYITVNDFWKEKNQCTETEVVQLSEVIDAIYHKNGINGNQVWLYPITNMGHTWPGVWSINQFGINAADEIWKFFSLQIENPTSTENFLNDELKIFPNPTFETINVKANSDLNTSFVIYNLSGTIIAQGILNASHSSIDVSRLNQGLYFLKVQNKAFKFQKL